MTAKTNPAALDTMTDRLEYGKFCQEENGPIEPHAEHRVLGYTAGFPRELIEFCSPSRLGLHHAEEALVEGTVLRPFRFSENHGTVFYRIGTRMEGGLRPRPYTLGRYLASSNGNIAPMDWFRAMGPLRGITRAEARSLSPVPLTHDEPTSAPGDRLFLSVALEFVVSGIGIQIVADEPEFFRLADVLWRALPLPLRDLFSAGWNVGTSLSAVLLASNVPGLLKAGPRYNAANCEWSGMSNVDPADLIPGRAYVRHFYEIGGVCASFDAKYEFELSDSRFPNLEEVSLRNALRGAGLMRRDEQFFDQLRNWSHGDAELSPTALASVLEALLSGPGRNEVLQWCRSLETSAEDSARYRLLLWTLLTTDPHSAQELRLISPKEAAMLAWLTAIVAGDPTDALRKFETMQEDDVPLPKDAEIRWLQILDNTLDNSECAGLHESLLTSIRGGYYKQWASRHALSLALTVASVAVLDILVHHYDLDPVAAEGIGVLLRKRAPDNANPFPSCLDAAEQQRLARLIEQQWQMPSIESLEWTALLPSKCFSDPLHAISAGGEVGPEILLACMQRASSLNLAEELATRLVDDVLRNVAHLRPEMELHPESWRWIVDRWPAEAALTAVDLPPHVSTANRNDWKPTAGELQERIEYWFSSATQRASDYERAQAIWSCAGALSLEAGGVRAIDLCIAFAREHLIEDATPDPDQVAMAVRVIRAAKVPFPHWFVANAWSWAQHGWQLRMLMDAAIIPEDPQPSAVQVAALIPHRKWLRAIADSRIQEPFHAAMFDFHEADYKSDLLFWRSGFEATPLWAAFRSLPKNYRGSLKDALDVYANGMAEQADCCIRHLESYRDDDAFQDVLASFLLPALDDALSRPAASDRRGLLLSMARAAGNSGAHSTWPTLRKQSEVSIEPSSENGIRWIAEAHKLLTGPSMFALLTLVLRDRRFPGSIRNREKSEHA